MTEYCVTSTEYGKVRGEKVTSAVGIPYIRFLGIPYAKPPVGERRFQNPIKPESWEGVYDALNEPSPCAGKNNYIKKYVGSDDCLYLNVYTKDLNTEKKCATIVYIHGGGFRTGSSSLYSYSPDFILMSDVVLVIFNYRLGPFGFANFKDPSLNIPGNAGMKDQQMAMRFVRDNIKHFGGDPSNITIMGHSSGAASVGLHCIAESSKGLFHKAVLMSGAAVGPICDTLQLDWTRRLAVKMGYKGDDDDEKEILKFLNSLDPLEMAEAADSLKTEEEIRDKGVVMAFAPHRELYKTESAFLLEPSINLLEKAWGNDIDIMIGGVKDEGIPVNDENYEIPQDLLLQTAPSKLSDLLLKVQKFYESKFSDKRKALEEFKADIFAWTDMMRTIKARLSSSGKGKTFLYKFCVDSPTQNHYRNRWLGKGSKGVVHADELSYIWHNGYSSVPKKDTIEYKTIERFTSIFTSFAINGNPNNAEIGEVEWHAVEWEKYEALIVDEKLEVRPLEEAERVLEFWKKFYTGNGGKFC